MGSAETVKRVSDFLDKQDFKQEDFAVRLGTVAQYYPQRGLYAISSGEGLAFKYGIYLSNESAIGGADKACLPIGTLCFYIFHPQLENAYILGAFPNIRSGAQNEAYPSFVSMFSGGDLLLNPQRLEKTPHSRISNDVVVGDVLSSDSAKSTALGGLMMLGLNTLVAQVKRGVGLVATEDGQTVLSGDRLLLRSALAEYKEEFNKWGLDSVESLFLSSYESSGFSTIAEAQAAYDNNDVEEVKDLVAIPTVERIAGDSIQGESKIVRAYAPDLKARIPVFKETIFRDGSYSLQSATGISFEKTIIIDDIQKRKAEDKIDFDKEKEFKPKDIGYEHDENKKVPGLVISAVDYYTYLVQVKYNEKFDFRWEHTAVKDVLKSLNSTGPLYKTKDFSALPKALEICVDAQNKTKRKVYESVAGFKITDDGSLVFYDGYGSQIIMSHGDIIFSPARDLQIKTGRDLVTIVPGEVNTLVKKSISVTSEEGGISNNAKKFYNVRTTAEDSGILVECLGKSVERSEQESEKPVGIVLKSAGVTSLIGKRLDTKFTETAITADTITLAGDSIHAFSVNLNFIGAKFGEAIDKSTPAVQVNSDNVVLSAKTGIYVEAPTIWARSLFATDTLLTAGSVVGVSGGMFNGVAQEIKNANSLKSKITTASTVAEDFTSTSKASLSKSSKAFYEAVQKLYINDTIEVKFRVASERLEPYDLYESLSQRLSDNSEVLVTVDPATTGIPYPILKATFTVLPKDKARFNVDGTVKEDQEKPPTDADLEEKKLEDYKFVPFNEKNKTSAYKD